jgi:hypothetical protein
MENSMTGNTNRCEVFRSVIEAVFEVVKVHPFKCTVPAK